VVRKYSLHFNIPPPKVRVGCEGCPHYVGGRCVLGYVACYDPKTKTITFSSEEWVREEVVLHELLHYAVDVGRLGYERVGVEVRNSLASVGKIVMGLGLMLTSLGLRLLKP
jgi:hypothetical protein